MTAAPKYFAHPTALISPKARIGAGTKIWAFAQIRENAVIGKGCVIGNGVYVDAGVRIGDRVVIQNKALLYRNLVVESDVFIGPAACFTNDAFPRANVIRDLKNKKWFVRKGASIGAHACVLPDIEIGRNAMVAAGAVVTKDVPENAIVRGVPAQVHGRVR
jgi:acetyltransferase-like isoleucine patch superfamily enzyme